ncbi:MAG: hypothetical protein RIR18_2226 [Pseudomonadota bacterium]|jgi:hydrogenase maturation protease
MNGIKPILVFGYGNPSRGDDALGPAFVDAVEALGLSDVECLTDYQLQVEHAMDLKGREKVVFVDASSALTESFKVSEVSAARDNTFTTHAISPAAVLQAYRQVEGDEPPPTFLLAIRGESFELGEAMSANAQAALADALEWFQSESCARSA